MTPLVLMALAAGCYPVAGPLIQGRDLKNASAGFEQLAADAAIAQAPRPGSRRFFEPDELAGIARAHALPRREFARLCFERSSSPLKDPDLIAAMREALDAPDAAIEIVAKSQTGVPEGRTVFVRRALPEPSASGGTVVWHGHVVYDGGQLPIWAEARIRVRQQRLVAASQLRAGRQVGPGDVRLEEADGFPSRVPWVRNPTEAVGRIVRRPIASGSPVLAGDLEIPKDVEKGQLVSVEVRSGGAIVRTELAAESAGSRGETIRLRNPASGKTFQARVEDKGRVVVEARP